MKKSERNLIIALLLIIYLLIVGDDFKDNTVNRQQKLDSKLVNLSHTFSNEG